MRTLILSGMVLAACAGGACADSTNHWQVLKDKSTLEWTASYGGKPVSGTFPDFTADIAFDPEHLDTSRATVKVETGAVKSGDHDAQENLPTGDWFAASQFPLATFEVTAFRHVKDDAYEADGTLTMRDKTEKVTLPFTAKFYDDKDASPPVHYARILGEATVKRTALGVGQGDWSQTDTIADDVKVAIHLEAKQIP
jgi:polyisoprenoid-binding protein YceI